VRDSNKEAKAVIISGAQLEGLEVKYRQYVFRAEVTDENSNFLRNGYTF
jgi:hypothetical protein